MTAYPAVAGPDLGHDALLERLLTDLHQRRNNAVCATLVYGSCLRSGDIYDGLLDLYLIVDNYRAAYGMGWLAGANWLLPPNVFYAEQKGTQQTLRAKVTVISLHDFQRGCSQAWFESYIWGRFAQPTHILHARDAGVRQQVEEALLLAARTLLQRALPMVPTVPAAGSVEALWVAALGLSYATELRTERGGRAEELVHASSDFYGAITRHHAAALGHGFTLITNGPELCYRSSPNAVSRVLARLSWGMRRVQGKLMSVARLVKALFTFEGGLDYIAWKLERHSGQEITIPDKVRRLPLIHLWGFFWGLYRQGIFK